MKCPLFHSEFIRMRAPELEQSDDCLKEECAWWDGNLESCLARSIFCEFATISELLVEIKDKMPRADQFTK